MSIAATTYQVLRTLKEANKPLGFSELKTQSNVKGANVIPTVLKQKLVRKLKGTGNDAGKYVLTAQGSKLVNDPEIKPLGKRGRPAGVQNSAAKAAPTAVKMLVVEPEPIVSVEADLLMANMTNVIHENAAYRTIIMEALNKMADQMGYLLVPKSKPLIQASDE